MALYRDLTLSLSPIHFWECFVNGTSGSALTDPDLGSLGDDLHLGYNTGPVPYEAVHQPGPSQCSFSLYNDPPGQAQASTGVDRNEHCLPGDHTVIAWVRPHDDTDTSKTFRSLVLNEVNPSPDFHWALYQHGGGAGDPRLGYRLFTGGVTTHMDARGATTITTSTWYMIAGRYDSSGGTRLDFFLNGALDATTTTKTGSRNGVEPQDVAVLSQNDAEDWYGHICLVSLFDYQLTDQNIADLYTAGFVCAERWGVNIVT